MGAKNDRETTRAGVIGDIHGDYGLFLTALAALGVECHARCDAEAAGHMSGRHTCWPENLWVIQLGDQIHRGRDGNLVLRMRDKLRAHSGGHYVDLWGNHEAQYRGGPQFWRGRGDEIDPALLDPDNSRAAAAAIVTDRRVWVASHAGITRGWVEASTATSDIDPSDPVELVREANRQWVRGDRLLFAAGAMLGHLDRFGRVRPGMTNRAAGPLWAEIGSEVLDSWGSGEGHNFSQIVGHSRIFDWEENVSTWQPKVGGVYVSQDRRRRWSTASFNRQLDASGEPQQVVCVEPQAGHRSKLGELHPYVIEGVQDVIYGEGR